MKNIPNWAILILAGLAVIGFSAVGRRHAHDHTDRRSIQSGGMSRSYLIHVPPGLPRAGKIPLVFVFHGGGSTAAATEPFTKFSDLADREKFIVIYPDAVGRTWNDGREDTRLRSQREGIDDVGFVRDLIDATSRQYSIDPKRIFATGISNGGMMSHYVGVRLSDHIAAIAPVAGAIVVALEPKFMPSSTVSVLIIHGTEDPLVPYHGGGVIAGRRGRVIDTDKTVKLWTTHDGCGEKPQTGDLPDRDKSDGCSVHWSKWVGGKEGTEVWLYRVDGGGHTWPGGIQYLNKRIIGNGCRDFDATQTIWDFFKTHPKG